MPETGTLSRESTRQALRERRVRPLHIPGFSSAAVLAPLLRRPQGIRLLFIVRPRDLPTHAGQIAFPGGLCESRDDGRVSTALREAHEELGIPPGEVDVLGRLDDVATPSGFVITPVVGWLERPPRFRPEPREVAEHFEVDVNVLREPARRRDAGDTEVAGRLYPLPEFHVEERRIWGATARMVADLLTRLDGR